MSYQNEYAANLYPEACGTAVFKPLSLSECSLGDVAFFDPTTGLYKLLVNAFNTQVLSSTVVSGPLLGPSCYNVSGCPFPVLLSPSLPLKMFPLPPLCLRSGAIRRSRRSRLTRKLAQLLAKGKYFRASILY